MKPADDRCEEHGLYLYRTGFGWSCKLGCYYCDDPQKIKEGYIRQYKEELREKINAKIMLLGMCSDVYVEEEAKNKVIKIKQLKEILKLLEE